MNFPGISIFKKCGGDALLWKPTPCHAGGPFPNPLISIGPFAVGTCDKRASDQVSYDIPLIQKIAAEPALKLV